MQRTSPFLALVKLELLRSATVYTNPLAWLLVLMLLAVALMPALVVWLRPETPLFLLLLQGWVHTMILWWLIVLIIECSSCFLRGIGAVLGPFGTSPDDWAEFLRSRAIDRRLHFRAKTFVYVMMFFLPMLLNFVLLGVLTGRFAPDAGALAAVSPDERLMLVPGRIAAPVAVTMLWVSLTTIVLAQGYYSLVSRWSGRRRNWMTLMLVLLPGLVLMTWVARFHVGLEDADHFSPQVRFFLGHWVWFTVALLAVALPVQRFSERSFANQEVL